MEKVEIRKTMWVHDLPKYTQFKVQQEIAKRLSGISGDRVMDGMSGRICDLEEIIHADEIRDWL